MYDMDWEIKIGKYLLGLLASVEIHKSVDLLASTCKITLPGYAYNRAFEIEDKLHRGDAVSVWLGYNGVVKEFEGYLLTVHTDGGSLTLECEDDLFLLRKAVKDKQFVNIPMKDIIQYLLDDAGVNLELDCSLTIDYDKFVISQATAYDVLKKIKQETKASIFLNTGTLHVHPPYSQHFDAVDYSFQKNIEKDDLKYVRSENKKVQIIVRSTGKDGKVKEVKVGTTGGDRVEIDGSGMSEKAMKERADIELGLHLLDGYEGSITGWLIPKIQPGDSANVEDEDYEYKNGRYFVNSVTTNFDENGGVRKIELGKRLTNG